MNLPGLTIVFWPPIYRDHEAERREIEDSRGVDDDIRIAIRRPVFGLHHFAGLRFLYRWTFCLGWLEIRRRERAGSWCCPTCEALNMREARTCACGLEWA